MRIGIYGGTFNLLRHTLPRDGITTTFVSAENPQEFEDAIQENTKLVYFETFGNPNADLPDFEAITAIAHKHHLPVIVDPSHAAGRAELVAPLALAAVAARHGLTLRERQLLEELTRFRNNQEIAEALSVRASTLQKHFQNMFRKFGVTSRWELMRLLLEEGALPWVPPVPQSE